ncbi:MAG: transcriptional regulator [Actinomycetota bacterium]
MPDLQKQIDDLDRIIHEPARLAILTVLSACEQADFTYLLRVTGLTNGNLSAHLARLESAGLVTVVKHFVGKRPQTLLSLTGTGREQVKQHWRRLEKLRADAVNIRARGK